MWTATLGLSCLLALIPEQSGKISIENARLLHGVPGLPRTSNKFVRGDAFVMAFDVVGIEGDPEGKVVYSLITEVSINGRLEYKHESKDIVGFDSLGGNSLPGFTQLNIGDEQPEGKYTVKVTAKDKKSNSTAVITKEFELVKPGLDIVLVRTTADRDSTVPTAIFATGESLWLSLSVAGFSRDSSKLPKLKLTMEIFDSNGKPTVKKPPVAEISKDVPVENRLVPIQFHASLNRQGKFTIKIKAEDQISGRTSSFELPIEVFHAK